MIYAKVGRLGHGKSMRMVVEGIELRELRAKRREVWLASNIMLWPTRGDDGVLRPKPPDGVTFRQLPMDSLSETLADLMSECREVGVGVVILLDELDEAFGATDWQNMSRGDRHRIKQSRKYGVDLIYTVQFIAQAEKSIRNVTEEAELLRAIPAPTIQRREAEKRPFLLRGQRFRPAAVAEISGEVDKDKRLGSSWYRYRREHELLYDTDEIIVPPRAEALCARHSKEVKEARCPMCHPPRPVRAVGELLHVAAATLPA